MRTLRLTFITFLAGVVAGCIGGPIIAWLIDLHTGQPTTFSIGGVLSLVPIFAFWVGVAILPVCLLVVAPIVHFLSPRSAFAHPICASLIGAFVGAFSIYLWQLAIVVQRPYVPDFTADTNPMFYSLALLVGAVGGLVCSLYARANVA